ncbi:MAG TPA: diguanylate cyclase, partial [Jatrophihabitantaceae bacterium]|nr:diguanylate cyclase [Jatrophihabitantaceae bacterium]
LSAYVFQTPHHRVAAVVLSGCADVASYALAAGLVRRIGFDPQLRRARDAWLLLGAGILAALCAAATTITVSSLVAGSPWSDWRDSVFNFWLGDATAVAASTPAILIVVRNLQRGLRTHRRPRAADVAELAAQVLLLGLCLLWAARNGAVSDTDRLAPLAIPICWLALRRREGGAAYAVAATGLGLAACSHQAGLTTSGIEGMQLFFLGLAVGAVCLGSRESDRNAASTDLTRSVDRLKHAFESATDAFVSIADDGRVIEWNEAATRLYGWNAAEAIGRNGGEVMIPARLRAEYKARWAASKSDGATVFSGQRVESIAMHRDGREVPVEVVLWQGKVAGETHIFVRDISVVKAAEQLLRESEERMRLLVESSTDYAIFMLDPVGMVQTWNVGAERITGYAPAEIIGRHYATFFPAEQFDAGKPEAILEYARTHGRCEIETWYRRKDGGSFWASAVITAMHHEDGTLRGFAEVTRDLTERKETEERLTRLATHDSLTGLPNRALIIDRLAAALQQASHPDRGVAVLFVDLDRFKAVNDSWGHDLGDQLLQLIADRIRSVLRSTDMACRLGGDEFVVVCDGFDDGAAASNFALRIEQAIKLPARFAGREISISASIGIALAGSTNDPIEVLERADQAMYMAKEAGRARHHVHPGGELAGRIG